MKIKLYKPQTEREEQAYKRMIDAGFTNEQVGTELLYLHDNLIQDADFRGVFKEGEKPQLLCGKSENIVSAKDLNILGRAYTLFENYLDLTKWDYATSRLLTLLDTIFSIEELGECFNKKDMAEIKREMKNNHFSYYFPIDNEENYARIKTQMLDVYNAMIITYCFWYYGAIKTFHYATGFDLVLDIARTEYYGEATLTTAHKTYEQIRKDFYQEPKLFENMYVFLFASLKHYEDLSERKLNLPKFKLSDLHSTQTTLKKITQEFIFKNGTFNVKYYFEQPKVKRIRDDITNCIKDLKNLVSLNDKF